MPKFLALLSAGLLSVATAATTPDKNTSAWWGHIKVLASNDFEGRLTGSPGYRKAAEYVAHNFEHMGLRPAGTDGFFQSVGFEVQRVDNARAHVSLARARGAPANVTDNLVILPSVLQRQDTEAPLIFAGYGIHLPEAGYDDFAGLNIRGAVVVYLVGGPEKLSGAQRAHATSESMPHYLEESGALGYLSITAPKNREVPWSRQKAAGAQPGMVLAEKALRKFQGPMFAAAFDETKADLLFAGAPHGFAELLTLAEAHKPLPHFPLVPSISAHVEATLSQVSSDNVVGELPGSDPALAKEAVVLTAHLDHLGTGKPDHGDGIFHGAMDDASGVATVLEVAKNLHSASVKPRRSILFVVVCGEEKGLLGSRYFAAHPTRHAGHIIADINTDMFLPIYPLSRIVGFGADESTIGDDVRAVAQRAGVEVVPDPQPDHLVFVRADQYSFVRKGTPAVMLAMSPRPGAEETTFHDWFQMRYHAQADDLSQPVDLGAADGFNRLVYELTVRIADEASVPKWNPNSFFGRFASHPLP